MQEKPGKWTRTQREGARKKPRRRGLSIRGIEREQGIIQKTPFKGNFHQLAGWPRSEWGGVRGQTTRWQLPIHRLTSSSAIFISTRENSAAVVGRIGSFWVSTDIGHTSQAQVQISYFLFSASSPPPIRTFPPYSPSSPLAFFMSGKIVVISAEFSPKKRKSEKRLESVLREKTMSLVPNNLRYGIWNNI